MDVNQTCDDLVMYTNIKSLCCAPNNIIMLYVNCTSVKNNNKVRKKDRKQKLANNENRAPPLPTVPRPMPYRTHTQTPQTWCKKSLKANCSPEKESSVSGLQVLRNPAGKTA